MNTQDKIYIHPTSFLFTQYPDYCVYKEITSTSKPYMKGITTINPNWLPTLGVTLCHFSQPLELPPPFYDPQTDTIKCTVNVTYGPQSWNLPHQEIVFPQHTLDCYRYFAMFLLDGSIFPKLKQLQGYWIAKPSFVMKSFHSNKVALLVQTLKSNEIYSKEKIVAKWKQQPKFLYNAICLWLDKQNYSKLEAICKYFYH